MVREDVTEKAASEQRLGGGEGSSAGIWARVGQAEERQGQAWVGLLCVRNRKEGSRVLRGRAVRRQGQRKHGGCSGDLPFMASGPL